jgi:hypothetical protein
MRRALRIVVGLALVLLGLVVLPAEPASAAELGAGPGARCNVDAVVRQTFLEGTAWNGSAAGNVQLRVKCNYGSSSSTVTGFRMAVEAGCGTNFVEYTAGAENPYQRVTATNSGGQFSATWLGGTGCSSWAALNTTNVRVGYVTFANSTTANGPFYGYTQADIVALTTTGSMPAAYPTDYYTGGVSPGPTNITRPAYECSRVYNATTGTVDLTATGPTGLPAGALSGAVLSEQWVIPWLPDGANVVPKVSTVTLPEEKPVGGWTLTFTANLTVTSPNYAFTPAAQQATAAYLPYLTRVDEWIAGASTESRNQNPVLLGVVRDGTTTLDPRLPHARYLGTADDEQPLRLNFDPTSGNVYGYWPRVAPEAERDPWVFIGKTTGASYRPAGNGFGGYWRVPVVGAGYDLTTTTHTSVRCQVLLDVARPGVGGTAKVGTGTPPAETDPPTAGGGGCDAGPLGGIPIIGGILDATASLACAIGDIVGRLGDLLIGLLGPPDVEFSDLWAGYESAFPFTVTAEASGLVGTVGSAFSSAADGSVCGSFDFSEALGGDQALNIKLPTPTGSGCAVNSTATEESERAAGDLFGWRTQLRTALLLLLSVGFMFRVVGAFSPKETGLEPGGIQ